MKILSFLSLKIWIWKLWQGLTPGSALCNLEMQNFTSARPKLDRRVTGHTTHIGDGKVWKRTLIGKSIEIELIVACAVVGCGWHSWMAFLLHYAIPLSEDRPRPLQTNALMPSHETNPIWMCRIKVCLEVIPMAFHMIYRLLSQAVSSTHRVLYLFHFLSNTCMQFMRINNI